jgi:mono/diheme cytochrome c family protein
MMRTTSLALGAVAAVAAIGVVLSAAERPRPVASHPPLTAAHSQQAETAIGSPQAVVDRSCTTCHNERAKAGGLSLTGFDVARAGESLDVTEKMIRKVRAGQMPPAGGRRPDEATLARLAEALETAADAQAGQQVVPGRRTFQRLNRAEYERSVRDLLALEVNAGEYLPLDTKSANFDNIADAQMMSPTVMQAYLTAAAEISRLALGDRTATAREVSFLVPRTASQREQVEGAPVGTRGGVSVMHTFPADGDYRFRVSFYHETTGALYGNGRAALHTAEAPEQIEISIDGARAALLDIDRWMNSSDPDGVNLRTEPIHITAGPHRVTAAFVKRFEGPVQDLITPLDWSIASTSIADAYGFTTLPHLRDMAITGPFEPTGVSETPSRQKVLACRPASAAQELPCAHRIISGLASQAFRRTATEKDVNQLMALYRKGAASGGFEAGIRMALEGVLASPRFVFRLEERPTTVRDGQGYTVSDVDLASRLSYFLWATAPDAELLRVAEAGRLSRPGELERQVARMLADPRADVLSERFAAQWLRLQDLDKIHPDVRYYPDADEQLKAAMRRETETFFRHIVREQRPITELFTADYTFVDERLARHYRIPGVVGAEFRKSAYPDGTRRGILAHASILTLTSEAERTSPVLRGKWVMEVLLGTPPPAPPPNIPALDETPDAEGGRMRTVRERLELHRNNPACMSCHRMIDPIGLALEHFDVTGAWRIKDNGMPIDPASQLYDGTPLASAVDLQQALMKRSDVLVRTFTENLATYALGRRLAATDMPMVRAVVKRAAANGHTFQAYVTGIVTAPAFRMKSADTAPTATNVAGNAHGRE